MALDGWISLLENVDHIIFLHMWANAVRRWVGCSEMQPSRSFVKFQIFSLLCPPKNSSVFTCLFDAHEQIMEQFHNMFAHQFKICPDQSLCNQSEKSFFCPENVSVFSFYLEAQFWEKCPSSWCPSLTLFWLAYYIIWKLPIIISYKFAG